MDVRTRFHSRGLGWRASVTDAAAVVDELSASRRNPPLLVVDDCCANEPVVLRTQAVAGSEVMKLRAVARKSWSVM